MAKAPVVPAAIIGTDHVFANGGFLPKLRVIYGKPLIFQGFIFYIAFSVA